jgi:very-short-patch-repair endonuclease
MVSGRTQIDFREYDVNILIEIQGLFWHYQGLDGFKVANDLDRKATIESLGYTLIYIDEDNANTDPVYYLREARAGRDWSRSARGAI